MAEAPERVLSETAETLPLPATPAAPASLVDTVTCVQADTSQEVFAASSEQHEAEGPPPRMLGEYELLEVLGRGGMGVVYRARQTTADRIVALKVIRPDRLGEYDQAARNEAIRRFQTETRAAARLQHDNLVTVYDVGEVAGCPYYSMRYIEGRSLADRIAEAPLSGIETARILEQIAAAVHHAHSQGVLHRDLKPQNILLDKLADRAFVADFGLAKLLDAEASEQSATRDPIGTLAYMAPEQTRVPPVTTQATDVWALGAIIYCCVTGRPPFHAKDYVGTFRQIQEADPAAPRLVNPDVDRDIETICLKCLEKVPERRYESAAALAEELGRYLRGEPILARPPGLAERVWRITRRRKGLVASAAAILVLLMGAVWAAAEARARGQATGQVGSLWTAQPGDLPDVVSALQPVMPRVEAAVRAELQRSPPDNNRGNQRRLRAALALLPSDPRQVDYLAGQLLTCEPELVLPLVHALAEHSESLTHVFWDTVGRQTPRSQEQQSVWFRRASALAQWDPQDARWATISSEVVSHLVTESSFLVADVWLEAFRPVSKLLLDDVLCQYDVSTVPDHRTTAAQVIAKWYAADAEALARFAVLADDRHYRLVAPVLLEEARRDVGSRFLKQYLAIDSFPVYRSQPTDSAAPSKALTQETHDRRKANAVAVLCHLNGPEWVWPFLKWQPDPQVRSYLIHRLRPDMLTPDDIHQRLLVEADASIRRALLLILGEYPRDRIVPQLTECVFELLATDEDSGVHSAAEWCLRKWGWEQRVRAFVKEHSAARPKSLGGRKWYINPAGHTMVVVPPGEFMMGSPEDEPDRFPDIEDQRRRTISHRFSISSTEVAREQFQSLDAEYKPDKVWSWDPQCPAGNVAWLEAAYYCNMLSELEGLPESDWCYPRDLDESTVLDARLLARKGYRLPTEAEWEYACRAGTITSRYYGSAEGLLPYYAWHHLWPPSSRPVGLLKPNDFGLFDMHGNAWEWCNSFMRQKEIFDRSSREHDHTNDLPIGSPELWTFLRSHPVEKGASHMRSAMRTASRVTQFSIATGFRVARTEQPE